MKQNQKTLILSVLYIFLFGSASINTTTSILNLDAVGRFDSENSQEPIGISSVSGTTSYNDNDPLDLYSWSVTISTTNGNDVVFNGFDVDFTEYFTIQVFRDGFYQSISNGDPVYVVDTDIKISFYDFVTGVSDERIEPITVTPLDPLFSYYDLPTLLSVDTYGFDTFNEGDSIDYTNWRFYVTLLNSGTQVDILPVDFNTYLTIYDTSPLSDTTFDIFVDFYVFDILLTTSVPINVSPYVPSYSISVGTLPNKTVFVVGDVVDFSGLMVDVYDYGTPYVSISHNDISLSYYQDFGGNPDYGNPIVEGTLFTSSYSTIDNSTVWVEYFGDDFSTSSTSFTVNLYPQNYTVDFTSNGTWHGEISSAQIEEVDFGGVNDTWIFTGESNAASLLELNTNNVPEGLMIGDSTIANYPTEVSMMSKYLWGTSGSSNGTPIVRHIYVRAYGGVGNNASLSVKVNNQVIGTEVLPTSASSDWMVFSASTTPIQVGHIELYFEADGISQINVQDLRIYSIDDASSYAMLPQLMGILSGFEALNSCVNNEEYLETNYPTYIDQITFNGYESIFNNILLLDQSTPGGLKNQLIVTAENKISMLLSFYEDTNLTNGLFARGNNFNQTPNVNISLLLLLIGLQGYLFIKRVYFRKITK